MTSTAKISQLKFDKGFQMRDNIGIEIVVSKSD